MIQISGNDANEIGCTDLPVLDLRDQSNVEEVAEIYMIKISGKDAKQDRLQRFT